MLNRENCWFVLGHKLKGIDGNDVSSGVSCQFIAGNGSSAPVVDFKLYLKNGSSLEVDPLFKGIKLDEKKLKGDLVITDAAYNPVAAYPISLNLDVIDYRSGNDHKAFIKAEYAKHKINKEALAGSGIKIVSCTEGMSTHQVDGIYGPNGSPVVSCYWKKGNGSQPDHHYGVVILK